jgi:hydrogenase maturation protease
LNRYRHVKRILVAGIGNIFYGDDAFGCEVVRQLGGRTLGEDVEVVDFGIRGYDLANALTSGYEMVILVDLVARSGEPGTLYVIEPDIKETGTGALAAFAAHDVDPVAVLQLAQSLGGIRGIVRLVGCEPEVLETDCNEISLSPRVSAAVAPAIQAVESLIKECLEKKSFQ